MGIKVGIPRALLYHNYYPLWESFLGELGAEVIVSGPTSSRVLNDGVKATVDEACLPVKLCHGHILALRDSVDILFLPRLVSVEKKAFICPKLMGLPDMVRQSIDDLPPLLDVCIDLHRSGGNPAAAFCEIGRYFTNSTRKIARAYRIALGRQARYEALLRSGLLPDEVQAVLGGQPAAKVEKEGPQIAVLGHPYNVYDEYVSQRLLRKLAQAGVRAVTADMVPDAVIAGEIGKLRKNLFWTLGRRILGAAYHFLGSGTVAGIIHLAAFGCGPDSLVGELVELQAKRQGKLPLMLINVDEHTGEAGLETRLEAFLDMIALRREANAGHFSPYGDYVGGA